MSTVAGERGAGDVTRVSDKPPAGPAPKVRVTWARVLIAAAVLVVLLSLVRVLSGATDLTSAGAVSAALLLAVPIAMAGLGGLWAERAGVVNIGLEGMMILGTWGAGWAGYQWGPWAGVLAALVFGAIGGLLHAVATVLFNVDHIVSGVAINILAFGATQFLSNAFFTKVEGGSTKQSPTVDDIGTVSVPLVGDGLRSLETQQWFLVSDVAGITRGLLTNVSWITLIAVLLLPLSFFVLWRTAFGLRLRACGESPVAAESLGVNVYKMKLIAVVASGAFAGLGGASLALAASKFYQEGQTGGRGYIGLAAMIFGNWRPGGLLTGSLLFGFTEGARLRQGGESVHALLLLIGVSLLALAVWQLYRARRATALLAATVGAAALWWYLATEAVPDSFTEMTPYVATLLVLALFSQRLRMPAADGQPYRRGEAG